MTRIVIVRHGNTFEAGETPRRIGARTDLPLTADGQAQADALGRWFAARGLNFASVIHGPRRRAADTARAILAHQPALATPELADWLDEIDHGPDEGMAEDEVIARIGADALADWEQHGTAPPGWIVDAPARLAGWRHLFDNATGDVLAVTSNGAGRFALLAQEIDLPPSLKQRTGAAGEFEREPDGTWRLTGWDQRPPR